MTRARSLLAIYGTRSGSTSTYQIFDTLNLCIELLNAKAEAGFEGSELDEFHDLLEQIGIKHRKWLREIWKRFDIKQEPILDESGKVLAQPLFWFVHSGLLYVCHENATNSVVPTGAVALTAGCALNSVGLDRE